MTDRPYAHMTLEQLQGIIDDPIIGAPAKRRAEDEKRHKMNEVRHSYEAAENGNGAAPDTEAPKKKPAPSPYDSQWESEYDRYLDILKRSGEIRDYRWKDFRFRVVRQDGEKDRYYSPEALVWKNDGTIEVHEIKGRKRDAGLLRFDLAREQWPMFRFRMIEKQKGGWVTIRGDKETP